MDNYQVFISYRRDGGDALAGRIADRLSALGYCVFFDVESMRSGTFNTQILNAIDKCEDVVLVLPPNALERCNKEDDWVRQELTYALKNNKNIIPVMMRGFEFPAFLPTEINAVRFMEGIVASNDYFDAVIDKLVSLLKSRAGHKKIVDEILYLTKQNNWSYSVQTSDSGAVFINYSSSGLRNIPKLNLCVCVLDEYNIVVIGRKVIQYSERDKLRVLEALNNINKKSRFVLFETSETAEGMYIQSRYDLLPTISNKAGVCIKMIDEITWAIDNAYPEIAKAVYFDLGSAPGGI